MDMTLTKTQEQILRSGKPLVLHSVDSRTFARICSIVAEAAKRYPEPIVLAWIGKDGRTTSDQVMKYLCDYGFVVRMENGLIEGSISCKALDEDLPFKIKVM